jgi:hypothetical protein
MVVSTRALRGAAVAGTFAASFMINPGAAGAGDIEYYEDFRSFDHSFTNFNNEQVTCTVELFSTRARPSSDEQYGGTGITDADAGIGGGRGGSCAVATVFVDAHWTDPDGIPQRAGAAANGPDVSFSTTGVGADYHVDHRIIYSDCDPQVSTCVLNVRTRPK